MAKVKAEKELYFDTTDGNYYVLNPDGTYDPATVDGAAMVTDGIVGSATQMVTNATATGTAGSTQLTGAGLKSKARYSATIGGNNGVAVTATVTIYGSDATMAAAVAGNKYVIGTLTLSGTGSGTSATPVDIDAVHASEHYWNYIWMDVTAISGTGATVNGWRGV